MTAITSESLNAAILERARDVFVGGVNSPVRAAGFKNGRDVLLKSGAGSKVYDYDGKEYVDYVLLYGALILGHAFPEITGAIKKAADSGAGFGTTHELEVQLAEHLGNAVSGLEKIRATFSVFVLSLPISSCLRSSPSSPRILALASTFTCKKPLRIVVASVIASALP